MITALDYIWTVFLSRNNIDKTPRFFFSPSAYLYCWCDRNGRLYRYSRKFNFFENIICRTIRGPNFATTIPKGGEGNSYSISNLNKNSFGEVTMIIVTSFIKGRTRHMARKLWKYQRLWTIITRGAHYMVGLENVVTVHELEEFVHNWEKWWDAMCSWR